MFQAFIAWLWTLFHTFMINVLRTRPIPEHVAIIMDGNRRQAVSEGKKPIEGHKEGSEALAKTGEIDAIMKLLDENLDKVFDNTSFATDKGICVRFIGERTMLRPELQEKIKRVEYEMKDNKNSILNICMCYTSRDEITNGIKAIAHGVEQKQITSNDVDEYLFEEILPIPKCDLLIRTSGEQRFSDFLLVQTKCTPFIVLEDNWPRFSFFDMIRCILYYQTKLGTVTSHRNSVQLQIEHLKFVRLLEQKSPNESKQKAFLEKVKNSPETIYK